MFWLWEAAFHAVWMEAVRGVDYFLKKVVNNRVAVSQNLGDSSLREELGNNKKKLIFFFLFSLWIGGNLGKWLKFSMLPCLFRVLSIFALFLSFFLLGFVSSSFFSFFLQLLTQLSVCLWPAVLFCISKCGNLPGNTVCCVLSAGKELTQCLLAEVSAPNGQDLNKFPFLTCS